MSLNRLSHIEGLLEDILSYSHDLGLYTVHELADGAMNLLQHEILEYENRLHTQSSPTTINHNVTSVSDVE